jgi:Putative metal-binding motif
MYKKTYILFLLLFIQSCNCGYDGNVSSYCEEETTTRCFISDEENINIVNNPDEWSGWNTVNSPCSLGYLGCDEENNYICEDYNPPQKAGAPETCDGIDNDCDFYVDEEFYRTFIDPENTCLNNAGGCIADQRCMGGLWECVLRNPEWCGPEVCDGADNDGNGLKDSEDPNMVIDEEWYWPEDLPSENYSFASDSRCRPGKVMCNHGELQVDGLYLPVEEQCENDIDDDCDGVVDELTDPNYKAAFVFVIDASGSMEFSIAAVANSVCNFAQNNVLEDSRFAIEWIGLQHPDASFQIIHGTDFVDSSALCEYLSSNFYIEYGGSEEYQIMGILAPWKEYPFVASDGTVVNNLDGTTYIDTLKWPKDLPKKVILFSDESIHLFDNEEDDLIDKCKTEPFSLGVFTFWENFSYWYHFVGECGGFVNQLYTSNYMMEETLSNNLTGDCGND